VLRETDAYLSLLTICSFSTKRIFTLGSIAAEMTCGFRSLPLPPLWKVLVYSSWNL